MRTSVFKKAIILLIGLYLSASSLFSQSFTEQTGIVLTGVSNGSVEWGDYDSDGDADILVTGFDNTGTLTAKVYRNNGSGVFSDQPGIFSPAIPARFGQYSSTSKWTDFNNDGLLDIMISAPPGSGNNSIFLYRNEGNNTFTLKVTIDYWTWQGNSLDCGDYDNDGDADILLVTNSATRIFQNQGNFIFQEQTSILLDGLAESASKWVDYDNDGDLDLLMTGFTGLYQSQSRLYKNEGNNIFTLQSGTSIAPYYDGAVDWGDYNSDGFLDILVSGTGMARVYKNNGNGTFTWQSGISLLQASSGDAKWGDLDSDGDLDIIISGKNNNIPVSRIFLNNGNNTFSRQDGIVLENVFEASIDLYDYDGDNDLDILLSGNTGSTKVCKVYVNNSSASGVLPATPDGLTSTVSGNDIILEWNPLASNSVSYNFMVGTTHGGIDVVSPNSSTATGFRRKSGPGNGQLNHSYILRNLKKGTYYWKVQAVDNSFKGGLFSVESSFTYSASVQAFSLDVPERDGTSAVLRWSRGNGAFCIVFMKEANTGTALPVNNTTYASSSVFKSGTQIGTSGWYCVYKGGKTRISVTGLKPNTDYIFQVFEYDGNTGSEVYDLSVVSGNPLAFRTGSFTEIKTANLLPVSTPEYHSMTYNHWIDIDNDGDLDAILSGTADTKLYRNDGSDVFTLLPVTLPSGYSISCADYDNDGYTDIIIAGNPTKIYKNNGNYTFTVQPDATLTGSSVSGSSEWGDYDNDGDLDVLITGQTESEGKKTKVFRNNGDNTFSEQQSITLTGIGFGFTTWTDYDNDGYLDIMISGSSNEATSINRIYRNNRSGNFIEQTGIILTGVTNGSADWGDYDSDGDPDLIITGADVFTFVTKIYRNDGNNFSENTSVSLPQLMYSSVKWGDYDNDGDLDILLSGYTEFYTDPVTKIFINNGDGSFAEDTNAILPGTGISSASWGDYDGDGDLDILLTGNTRDNSISRIYRNDLGSTPNARPAAPAGLTSSVEKSDVTLRWKNVRSDNTPYKAMTYNVRAGTVPGGSDIVSPHSSATGVRSIVRPGNALQDTSFIFRKMKFGTYYWSVQAVDNGFSGSTFASEGSFTVSPVQAKALTAKILDRNSLLLKWERGNGDRCAVFCKQTSAGSAVPVNNSSYVADSEYGYGGQIGSSGWYCVYNGRADSVVVTGLVYNKQYSFHIFEYMGSFGSEQYFTQVEDGNPGVFSTSLFTEQTGIVLGTSYNSAVVWADYDNDGFSDFLLPGFPSRIYRNNGNNTFTEKTDIAIAGFNQGSAAWGDYDNDKDLDLIISGASVNSYPPSVPVTKLYRNDGSDMFTEITGMPFDAVYNSSVEWGDYDNDGDLDLLLTGATAPEPNVSPVSKIYENNGNGTFTENSGASFTGILRGSGKWTDFDNDGDLDVIIVGATDYQQYGNGVAEFYRNNGNRTFTPQAQGNVYGVGWSSSSLGDFDNDGDMDLIISTRGGMYLYMNEGNSVFSYYLYFYMPYQGSCYAAWGDYDNDGYLDFILTNPGLDTKLYRNTQGISMPGAVSQWFIRQDFESLNSIGYGFVNWIDYDNDGDLDFLMSKENNPTKIFMNNTIMRSGLFKADKAPEAPTGLVAVNSPSGVGLKWNSVRSDETPYRSMSYNIMVSTDKDSSNVSPPNAHQNGYRKIVGPGNAQLDSTSMLRNLPSKKYFWKVQAIDQSYIGGAWSAVDSFEVKNVQTFYSADTVCLGYSTSFRDESVATSGIASWRWDFKDGTTSTLRNPSHTYAASGTYNVKLVITDAGGTKDSLEKAVVVKPKPLAGFDALSVCQGIPVTATNTTDHNGQIISSWSWDFGDGSSSSLQQPAPHPYLTPADYTIRLKAIASNGCADSVNKVVSVGSYPVAAVTSSGPLTFCKGDSVTLSVPFSSEYSYAWMISGTDLTGATGNLYRAKNSGSYSVKITNPKGNCISTSPTVAVTSLDAPSAPLISSSGNSVFCQGDSVVLSATAIPGITYDWKRDGGSVGSNNTYPAKVSGEYLLVISNSSGCKAGSTNRINVTANPAPVSPSISTNGVTTFCEGGSVNLSVPSVPGNSYFWKKDDGTINGAEGSSYVATVSGSYLLDIKNSYGCSTRTLPVNVTVKQSPLMPVLDSLNYVKGKCPGENPVRLSAKEVNDNYQYLWYKDGVALDHTLPYIDIYEAGYYRLSASLDGCIAESKVFNADFPAGPAKPLIYAQGPSFWYLACSDTTANKYKWYFNGKLIEGADRFFYIANYKLGTYQVSIANKDLCYTRSDMITIPPGYTAIDGPEPLSGILIYPNPTTGSVNITVDNNQFGEVVMEIFSIEGRKIMSRKYEKTTEHFRCEADLSGHASGMYIVHIVLNKISSRVKIMLE